MYISLMFIPDYVDVSKVLSNELTELSEYDYDDCVAFNNAFRARVITNKAADISEISSIMDHYHKPGTYVFSDNNVTMGSTEVFCPIKVPDGENRTAVYVRCMAGSSNLCTQPNAVTLREFRKWLVGYLVKNFGFDNIVKHDLFTRLWLSNIF